MKEFSYVITDALGIHARPAGLLVKEAGKFSSAILVNKAGKKGDAKKIFSIMSLGAKKGDTITITAEGEDEEQAVIAMEQFIKANL